MLCNCGFRFNEDMQPLCYDVSMDVFYVYCPICGERNVLIMSD